MTVSRSSPSATASAQSETETTINERQIPNELINDMHDFCQDQPRTGHALHIAGKLQHGLTAQCPTLDLKDCNPGMLGRMASYLGCNPHIRDLTLPRNCSVATLEKCLKALPALRTLAAPQVNHGGEPLNLNNQKLAHLYVTSDLKLTNCHPYTSVHHTDESILSGKVMASTTDNSTEETLGFFQQTSNPGFRVKQLIHQHVKQNFNNSSDALIFASETYLTQFKGVGEPFSQLIQALQPGELRSLINNCRCYGSMPSPQQEQLFHQRDITNIAQRKIYQNINQVVLGCKGSYLTTPQAAQNGLLDPGKQMSWSMPTLMHAPDEKIHRVQVMAVTAPALDTTEQPEWSHYVDQSGNLRETEYRLALETISNHIVRGARDCGADRVVMSAFGMDAFLSGLTDRAEKTAKKIGVEVIGSLIHELRNNAKPTQVVYTDVSPDKQFWKDVNALNRREPIEWIGKIPGNWVKEKDMIVNAADPHSLSGNGCRFDRSLDGAIGTNSLVHFQHMLACKQYSARQ